MVKGRWVKRGTDLGEAASSPFIMGCMYSWRWTPVTWSFLLGSSSNACMGDYVSSL